MSSTRAERLRETLGHPVVDADGHMLELEAGFYDVLTEVGGHECVARLRREVETTLSGWSSLTPQGRLEHRAIRPPWGLPTKNTLDLATAMLPRLLYERLPTFGIDFAIVYPTLGMLYARQRDEELRGIACRAVNIWYSRLFRDLSYRLTPAAIIPTYTPTEAIRELEHVRALGLKVAVFDAWIARPIPAAARAMAELPRGVTLPTWLDTYAIDSAYDYDPFWRRCIELGFAATTHTAGHFGSRTSVSNYVHNHLGLFASSGEALARALFLGGVTRRFPALKFAFLEGGVGWAVSLFSDLVEHWEKRNLRALEACHPSNLDERRLEELWRSHGGAEAAALLGRPLRETCPDLYALAGWAAGEDAWTDDFAECGISEKSDIRERFVPSFFFGCEGDDRVVSWAFRAQSNPFGARLRAFLGSDIGHWDVTDMADVLVEAHKLVERGLLSPEDFRDFVFTNAVTLHGSNNPSFFAGTAIERDAAQILSPR
jgi:predicted TIM-barrel fold metal-dependent hydrolase